MSSEASRGGRVRVDRHHPADRLPLQGKVDAEAALVDEQFQALAIERPVDAAIREQEGLRVGGALEAQAERLAGDAVRAVRPDQVAALDRRGFAGRVTRLGAHAVLVLREPGDLRAALDRDAVRRQVLDQHGLDLRLRHHQQERERRVGAPDIVEVERGCALPADIDFGAGRHQAEIEERLGEPDTQEQLHRARLDAEGARFLRGARALVQDAHRHAATVQQRGRHQSGRPGPDDQDIRPAPPIPIGHPEPPVCATLRPARSW